MPMVAGGTVNLSPRAVVFRRMHFLLCVLAMAGALLGQSIRVVNLSPYPFDGWVRTTIDESPPANAGAIDGALFVVGNPWGLDTKVLDLRVPTMAPGESRTFHLGAATPVPFHLAPPPADPSTWAGGPATLNGQPMAMIRAEPNGAGWDIGLRGRAGRMFVVDVALTWRPDEPWAPAEFTVTCCSPTVPDLTETVADLRVQFGDAVLSWADGGIGAQVLPAGLSFAHGQSMIRPGTFTWLRHVQSIEAWTSSRAASTLGVQAIGISRLLPAGVPAVPAGFNVRAWSAPKIAEGLRRLTTWEPGTVGATASSGVTGDQEDQVFVRAEPFQAGGAVAVLPTYLAALAMAKRPCHFVEQDGSWIQQARHPSLIFWSGRPHWHTGVSPDQLGRPRALLDSETHGWSGPDREHWLYNTVAAGARMAASWALQRELEAQAVVFLFGETTRPGLSTSGPDAARSVGWAGIIATHLWLNLHDRALAEAVRLRWHDRVNLVYLPAFRNVPGPVWDRRLNDARLGSGWWWMPWQQSIGAYGLWLGCKTMGPSSGIELAVAAAEACVANNWVRMPGESRYRGVGNQPWTHDGKLATDPYEPLPLAYFQAPDYWKDRPRWFETTWDVPAIAVVMERPDNEKAQAIWAQLQAEIGASTKKWWPPEIVPQAQPVGQ